jgi:hypothetical protein
LRLIENEPPQFDPPHQAVQPRMSHRTRQPKP